MTSTGPEWRFNQGQRRWENGQVIDGVWRTVGSVGEDLLTRTDVPRAQTEEFLRKLGITLPDEAWPYTTDGDLDGPLIEEIARMLYAIEGNYRREGTCTPGGRFYGQRLEIVQARAVLRHIRQTATERTPR